MNENQQSVVTALAITGGIVTSLIIGAITGVLGGIAAMGVSSINFERGGKITAFGFLLGFLIPAAAMAGLWLLSRLFSRGFALGVLIGGSLMVLACGLCNGALMLG